MQLPHSDELVTRSQGPLSASENGKTSESETSEELQTTAENPVGRHETRFNAQKAKIHVLKTSKEKYARKYEAAKKRIVRLESEMGRSSRVHQEDLEKRDEHIRVMEDELERTNELLSERTKELSGAQSFLSTTDRLSEAEVLGIVRDLNQNIFQAAANLSEEWEKLASTQSARVIMSDKTLEDFSQFYGPIPIYRASQWDPVAVTFLVQVCLCHLSAQITTSWRCKRDGDQLGILSSIYKHLSAFGKYTSPAGLVQCNLCISETQAISARWRSLTHDHLLTNKPSSSQDSAISIAEHVANILWITGSFESIPESLDFVKEKAFNRIKTIYQTASRLESVFMVGVTSCDMYVFLEATRTEFDGTRMTKEFESDGPSSRQGVVAGTTGVGVVKKAWERRGEGMRMEFPLKATVVLEGDFADS